MGRNAKPIELLVMEGKTHVTKEQIAQRRACEMKQSDRKIRADSQVLADPRALREFQILRKLYRDIPFMGALDNTIINQYCMAVSELEDLTAALAQARSVLREDMVRRESLNLVILLDVEIRQKRGELIKLSDRLYLNPVARTKNLPRKEEKEKENERDFLFGDSG